MNHTQYKNQDTKEDENGREFSEQLRRRILLPGTERDHFYEIHPVVTDQAIIATKPIQQCYDLVVKNIIHRQPGTCLIGEFRTGKSKAIEKISNELKLTFPKLPVDKVVAKGHDPYTEKTFFTDLLSDFKHGGANTGTTIDRRNRLLMTIEARAKRQPSDRYLLIVDEAQNWNEIQLQLLRDISNDLKTANITLITVMFAHPALLNLRSKLINYRRTDLIGRFLLSPYEFKGLSNVDELTDTLRAYDDSIHYEYPPRSRISYSEFFMPLAWESGWRLATEAEFFWSALTHVASRVNHTINSIGMNWVGGSIRNFLFSQSIQDYVGYQGNPDTWLEAVESSDYESSLF